MQDLDERYSLYVLRAAISRLTNLREKEHDYLLETMFNCTKVQTSFDYMYLACT